MIERIVYCFCIDCKHNKHKEDEREGICEATPFISIGSDTQCQDYEEENNNG